ncbi:MAG: hypothetical protein HXY40_12165 [Chloroflexi bacterium]|nr:hypothetical protein [Chloroflexota bacterium]
MRFVPKWFQPSDALFLLLAAGLVAWYVYVSGGGFPLDDSWIHQGYARNLALRGEWAFIPGVPSGGSTSPLYTVLLAAGYALRIDYALWTHALGVLTLAAAGMFGARLAARLSARLLPNTSSYVPLATGLALVLAWHLVWAAASGMETMLFSTLTLALLLAAVPIIDMPTAEETALAMLRRGLLFGVLTALAMAARPEGVLLSGLIGLTVLIIQPRGFFVWAAGAALGFALCGAPYFVLNFQLTGGLLPNTAAAKQAAMLPALQVYTFPERLGNMWFPLIAGGQLMLVPGVVAVLWLALRGARQERAWLFYLLPLLWALLLTVLYAARLPAWVQHGRYVMPLLPAMIVVGTIGTFWLLRRWKHNLWGRLLTRAPALTAILIFVYFALVIGSGAYRSDVAIINEEHVATALWMRDNLPPDELLAIHDIGAVGYFAPRPMLDIAGLVSPEVIPIILDADAMWALMQQRGARYLMAFVDQIPGDNPNDPRLCPIYRSPGTASPAAGGPTMVIYALAWDHICP